MAFEYFASYLAQKQAKYGSKMDFVPQVSLGQGRFSGLKIKSTKSILRKLAWQPKTSYVNFSIS